MIKTYNIKHNLNLSNELGKALQIAHFAIDHKEVKNREHKIVKDLNHKISKFIVNYAYQHETGIKLENLSGIRQRTKSNKEFKYNLHSWSYYQLRQCIEYKAKLLGVEINLINPAYTSQQCSRCGELGDRNGKEFKCPNCGHVDHADVNAAFNIASRPPQGVLVDQLQVERDICNGSTDTPKMATQINASDHKSSGISYLEESQEV